jgi:hypothetical protein
VLVRACESAFHGDSRASGPVLSGLSAARADPDWCRTTSGEGGIWDMFAMVKSKLCSNTGGFDKPWGPTDPNVVACPCGQVPLFPDDTCVESPNAVRCDVKPSTPPSGTLSENVQCTDRAQLCQLICRKSTVSPDCHHVHTGASYSKTFLVPHIEKFCSCPMALY